MIRAVLWDFGGVILTSPFEAFAAYERQLGLPEGFIRRVNATDPTFSAAARRFSGRSSGSPRAGWSRSTRRA